MLWKVKEFNTIIKKELIIYKVALNTLLHKDNKNKEMSGILKPSKNNNIPPCDIVATPISNYVLMNKDDLDFDIKWHIYETALIASSYN